MEERFEAFTSYINEIQRNIKKIKIKEMKEYDLKNIDVSVIYYIFKFKSLTSKEIVEKLKEDKALVSRSVEYLINQDILTQEKSNIKKYNVKYYLSNKGNEVGEKIVSKIDKILFELNKIMTKEEREKFYKQLEDISNSLDVICKGL